MESPGSAPGGSKRPRNIRDTTNFTSFFQTDSSVSEEIALDPDVRHTEMPEPHLCCLTPPPLPRHIHGISGITQAKGILIISVLSWSQPVPQGHTAQGSPASLYQLSKAGLDYGQQHLGKPLFFTPYLPRPWRWLLAPLFSVLLLEHITPVYFPV